VTVAEKTGAVELITSSMSMEIKAITEVLAYLEENVCRRAVIVTDSMSTLQKIRKKLLYVDWISHINASNLHTLTWIFCPGHSGVLGNERADSLAGTAEINNDFTLDPPCSHSSCQGASCCPSPPFLLKHTTTPA